MLDRTYVVFDLEATGLSYKKDSIIEIGAVKIKNGEIIDEYSQLINPKRRIRGEITELTGITNKMVKDEPVLSEVIHGFREFIGEDIIVAHNAKFDMGFMGKAFDENNIRCDNIVLDTLELSKKFVSGLKDHKLNTISARFNIDMGSHHRALDDAKTAALILHNILLEMKKQNTELVFE